MNKFARRGSGGEGPPERPSSESVDQPIQWVAREPAEKQEAPVEAPLAAEAQDQPVEPPIVEVAEEPDEAPVAGAQEEEVEVPVTEPPAEPVQQPQAQVRSSELTSLLMQIAELSVQVAKLQEEVAELRLSADKSEFEDLSEALTPEEEVALTVLQDDAKEPEQEEEVTDLGLNDDDIERMLEAAADKATPTTEESEREAPVAESANAEEPEEAKEDFEVPIVFGGRIEFEKEAVKAVPPNLAIGALAIPVRIEEGTLFCKSVEPFDQAALDQIAKATSMKVEPEAAAMPLVLAALREAYRDASREAERDGVAGVAESKRKGFLKRRAA
ncbi:MAG TPA: hypothetical protein VNI20_08505 [Fimbriimonadaceae bacterium]|nr:hypothetical protein [Fimbriimonadaceae bacterium]